MKKKLGKQNWQLTYILSNATPEQCDRILKALIQTVAKEGCTLGGSVYPVK